MAKIDSRVTRVENDNAEMQQVKCKIANVASSKNVSINYGTDTMVDVLDNIDNNTIPTPSGTLSITSNNTYDVTNYASADVNVVPSLQNKSVTITQNGTQTISADVGYDGLNEVEITTNVSGGGSGEDYLAQDLKGILTDYSNSEVGLLRDRALIYSPLEKISLPNCVYGGVEALAYCKNLKQINMENCLVASSQCFYNCSSLQQVSFPKLIDVMSAMFFNVGFSNIDLPYCSFISNQGFQSCYNLSSANLPNCITIYSSAFNSCSSLETINIPCLWNISSYAFTNCRHLSSVSFPLVTAVNSNTFFSCSNLSQAYLPNCAVIYNSAFNGCTSLQSIICAASFISTNAFNNCSSLESVYLLNASMTFTLGNNAFSNTPIVDSSYLGYYGSIYVPSQILASLKTQTNWVSISDRLTELPSSFSRDYVYAFEFQNSNIAEIPSEKVNCIQALNYAFRSCTNLSQVSLPNCSYLAGDVFYGCSNLSQMDLPNCITLAGNNLFYYCQFSQFSAPNCENVISVNYIGTNSTSLTLPKCKLFITNMGNNYVSLPNCEMMGTASAFHTTYLSEINFPNCKYVYNYAFTLNNYLSEISLPNCEYLGLQAFQSCTNLRQVNLPNCLYVNTNAFASCTRLTEIILPKCKYFLGMSSCASLYKVELPECQMFGGINTCPKLSQVIIGTNMSEICGLSSATFGNTPITDSSYLGYYGSIYVPDSLVSAYQTAPNWSSYSARITGISNLPSI